MLRLLGQGKLLALAPHHGLGQDGRLLGLVVVYTGQPWRLDLSGLQSRLIVHLEEDGEWRDIRRWSHPAAPLLGTVTLRGLVCGSSYLEMNQSVGK